MDWTIVATLFSSFATLLLAIFTFIQVFMSNRAKISISSEFDELYNRYYLVMRNIGNLDCVIHSIEYSKSSEEILRRSNRILPENCIKYKLLPFQGFVTSTICPGASKFCELRLQELFTDETYKIDISITVEYSYDAFLLTWPCETTFNVSLSEYLSTRTSFTKAKDLKESTEMLARSLDLFMRGYNGGGV